MKRTDMIGALALGVVTTTSAASWTATAHACGAILPTCTAPVRLFPIEIPPHQSATMRSRAARRAAARSASRLAHA